jgi:multiple sugar transport system substrate-binding protein
MPNTHPQVAIREFTNFKNALVKQIALYPEQHPDLAVKAFLHHLDKLRGEIFENNGLRSGAWDISFINTDWPAETVNAGAKGQQRIPVQRTAL